MTLQYVVANHRALRYDWQNIETYCDAHDFTDAMLHLQQGGSSGQQTWYPTTGGNHQAWVCPGRSLSIYKFIILVIMNFGTNIDIEMGMQGVSSTYFIYKCFPHTGSLYSNLGWRMQHCTLHLSHQDFRLRYLHLYLHCGPALQRDKDSPISLLSIPLLRLLDSSFPGNSGHENSTP